MRLIGNQVDDAIRNDDIGDVVGNRQMLNFAEPELDIGRSDPLGVGTRLGEHLMRHVDTDHAAGQPD